MPQIFVFTAGNPEARQHLLDSIQNPIEYETVFDGFAEPHHDELERIHEEGNGFYAWGALPGPGNRRTWEAMERDDGFCASTITLTVFLLHHNGYSGSFESREEARLIPGARTARASPLVPNPVPTLDKALWDVGAHRGYPDCCRQAQGEGPEP